jgi:ATP-dependent protease ClpP protease subunit
MHIDLTLGSNLKPEPLVTEPSVVTVTSFDEEGLAKFTKDFAAALASRQSIIPVVIDSFGGQVYSLFGMIDQIRAAQARGVIIATLCRSKAMSCGAVLLSCGSEGYRYISEHATVLVHQVSNFAYGKIEEIQVTVEHTRALNTRLLELLSKNCGKKKSYWSEQIKANGNADIYLSPEQAVQHNLANAIGSPVLSVDVAATYSVVTS